MMIENNDSIKVCMLTTFDNPYNYFTQFNEWLMFDKEKGYDSCERLARIVETTDDMSEVEEQIAIEKAIDEIIKYDILNIYTKVYKDT